jgi:hypothetical protein
MSEEEKQELARQINRMIAKTLQRYLMALIAVFVMVFGWHEIRIMNMDKKLNAQERETQEVQSDFGYSSGYLSEKYPDCLIFKSTYQKYVIERGQ